MSYEYLYGLDQEIQRVEPLFHQKFRTRGEELELLGENRAFDVAIVGGGLAALSLARSSAFHGFRTLLLCEDDIGLPRGTPLFRPLLINSLEDTPLLENVSHLCTSLECRTFRRSGNISAKLRRLFSSQPQVEQAKLYSLQRLALELAISARREGATLLNFASLQSFGTDEESTISLSFADLLENKRYEIASGIIFNLSQNLALGRVLPRKHSDSKDYLLRLDALLPLERAEGNRIFYRGEEVVGTFTTPEGSLLAAILKLPLGASPTEIITRIGTIFGDTELALQEKELRGAHRTIVPRRTKKLEARLWSSERNFFSVIGETLFRGEALSLGALFRACSEANIAKSLVSLDNRRLPGTLSPNKVESLVALFKSKGIEEENGRRLISLFGRRAEEFLESEELLTTLSPEVVTPQVITPQVINGAVVHAHHCELAVSAEDIVSRRLLISDYTEGLISTLKERVETGQGS